MTPTEFLKKKCPFRFGIKSAITDHQSCIGNECLAYEETETTWVSTTCSSGADRGGCKTATCKAMNGVVLWSERWEDEREEALADPMLG